MDHYDRMRLVYKLVLTGSAIISLFFWKYWKNSFWKWIPFYLLAVTCLEWYGNYLRIHTGDWISDPDYYSFIVHPFIFLFIYISFLHSEIGKGRGRLLAGFIVFVYVLSCFVDYFILKNTKLVFGSFSYMIGVLFVVLLGIRFYSGFLFNDSILSYRNHIGFWYYTIWLVYYAGTFPFFAIRNTLYSKHKIIFKVYWDTQIIMSMSMYFFISILYIWFRKK